MSLWEEAAVWKREEVMGKIILAVLIGLEIGLCVYTLGKQRDTAKWIRNRMMISGIQWGMILLTLLLPIGNKGLRFAGAGILLGVRFLIGGLRYLLQRKKAKGFRGKLRTVLAAAFGCLFLFLSCVPALVFTGYRGLKTTGQYRVKQASAILTDAGRPETYETDGSFREVPIHVYYPEVEKSGDVKSEFPFILFSHGAFGYYQSNTSTYMELASHGYVVVSLDHPYHSFYTKDSDGKTIIVDRDFLQSAMYIGGSECDLPEEEIFRATRDWINLRLEDVEFVLVVIQAAKTAGGEQGDPTGMFPDKAWTFQKDRDIEEFAKIITMTDTDKIGVMGHSLGGAAGVTMGRLRSDVDAVIDLDGTMLGEQLDFREGQYVYPEDPYPVPLLSVNNERHQTDSAEAGPLYVNVAVLENARDARYTYFVGSEHMNFTDLPLMSPFLARLLGTGSIDAQDCIETMNGIVLQFFDYYLKGMGELQIRECY